jgi:hypothetical protein
MAAPIERRTQCSRLPYGDGTGREGPMAVCAVIGSFFFKARARLLLRNGDHRAQYGLVRNLGDIDANQSQPS